MSLASAYATRMSGEGEMLSAEGAYSIDELEAVNTAQSVTLAHGWLAGSKMNMSAGKVLDLVGTTDFVHVDTGDSTLHVGEGTITLEGSTAFKGCLDAGDQVFTNDDWTALVMLDKPSRDFTFPSDETSLLLSQYEAFASGHFYISGDFNESITFTWLGSSGSVTLKAASTPLSPVVVWLVYTHSTRTVEIFDAFTGDSLGTSIGVDLGSGNAWAAADMRIGGLGATGPRLSQFGGLFKFTGVLNETKRNAIFSVYYDVMTRYALRVLVYGNSVTSGSDATGFPESWVGQLHLWLAVNNGYCWSPANMGGKGLAHYRTADYTLAMDRAAELGEMVDRLAAAVVENYIDKRIDILVLDENQNTAAGVGFEHGGFAVYDDYGNLIDNIANALRATVPSLKIVSGTMMGVQAIDYQTFEPLTYAQVAADGWRVKLRDWSASVRADGRFAEVFDLFATFSDGWDTPDDGNPPAPVTDLPNGKPAYFFDDPQHPSDTGHAVMFAGYRDAIIRAAAQESGMSWSQVFFDNFNRANGAVGNGWTEDIDSMFSISLNKLICGGAGYTSQKGVSPAGVLTDCRVQAAVTTDGSGQGEMLEARQQASGINCYIGWIGSGYLAIGKLVNGVQATIDFVDLGLIGVPVILTLDCVGTQITVSVAHAATPDIEIDNLTITDATFVSGTAGLAGIAAGPTVDNFYVYEAASSSSPGFVGGGYGGYIIGG